MKMCEQNIFFINITRLLTSQTATSMYVVVVSRSSSLLHVLLHVAKMHKGNTKRSRDIQNNRRVMILLLQGGRRPFAKKLT
jgi:hypothetical protein